MDTLDYGNALKRSMIHSRNNDECPGVYRRIVSIWRVASREALSSYLVIERRSANGLSTTSPKKPKKKKNHNFVHREIEPLL